MSLRSSAWNAINLALKPLGYELKSRTPAGDPLTMQGALERFAGRGDGVRTVVDIGAAKGRWTRMTLPLFPAARFLLLEPLEERRAALESLHREHSRTEFLIAAAGDSDGEAMLTVASDLDGSGICDAPSSAARPVPLVTIDSALRERGLQGPYLLKFDTHGFEVPILAGAAATLKETELIVMEVYNFQLTARSLRFHEMCLHLDALGFRCAEMVDVTLRPKDKLLWQADCFFLRKDSSLFSHSHYC